ncbi:MAG: response regulator [Gammaproteobacteria bacterium]|nr:response regulator [Gammaproteobacteria bacterium]
MRSPASILVVDDNAAAVEILEARLSANGYTVLTARDGEQALALARSELPDLILLDIMMPKVDGLTVCRELKADSSLPLMPIVLLTAKTALDDVVQGLDAGADEYLTKPVEHAALLARVKSMLRIKSLHDQVSEQTRQLAEWNRTLEQRVAEQVEELQRVGRLKRFFSPQLAEVIVSQGGEQLLEAHRREISVVFCDLRGFSAFSEAAEPEEVMEVLREYYAAMGEEVFRFEGTIERFVGDSVMALFNDPLPCPDHELRAVRMAVAMRKRARELSPLWAMRGYDLGIGFGVATGYATIGKVGFEGRIEYSATGPVANLASRLCDVARHGQVLIDQHTYAAVGSNVAVEALGELELRGMHRPAPAYNVLGLNGDASPSGEATSV